MEIGCSKWQNIFSSGSYNFRPEGTSRDVCKTNNTVNTENKAALYIFVGIINQKCMTKKRAPPKTKRKTDHSLDVSGAHRILMTWE